MPRYTRLSSFLFWFLCLGVALVSFRFLAGGVEVVMNHVAYHATERTVAFYAHVVLGSVALMLLPFQFSRRLRNRRLTLHRWMGRAYGLAILLAGIGGGLMAINTNAGPVAAWGFGFLAPAWIATTAVAVWHAMRGEIDRHRRWIIRSAALTFAAVTLRLELPMLAVTVGMETGYPIVAWLCWVPNMIWAEWYLGRAKRRPTALPA